MLVSDGNSMTSVNSDTRTMASATAPDRLTAAETPRPSRLGSRLALSVAVSVAAVVSLVAMVGAIIASKQLEADLREWSYADAHGLFAIQLRRTT